MIYYPNPYPGTPAMAAGASNYIWTVDEVALLKTDN